MIRRFCGAAGTDDGDRDRLGDRGADAMLGGDRLKLLAQAADGFADRK